MKRNGAVTAAWIAVSGTILAAVIAGVFSLIQSNNSSEKPIPPPVSQQPQPDAKTEPLADSIQILDSRFDVMSTGQEYLGGHVRVGYCAKGLIQSSCVTSVVLPAQTRLPNSV
jgi:hypothetical protein